MRLNLQGIVGLLGIIMMFGIAYLKDWNISWTYFVLSVFLYSIAIVVLTGFNSNNNVALFTCHFSILFLSGGLWLQDSGLVFNILIFISCIIYGYLIAFILFHPVHSGLIGFAISFLVASYMYWQIPWLYFCSSLILYLFVSHIAVFDGIGSIVDLLDDRKRIRGDKSFDVRNLWGAHSALIFLSLGMMVNVRSISTPNFVVDAGQEYYYFLVYIAIFISSASFGFALPYLVFKKVSS